MTRAARAFSLIEVVLALAIGALLMLTVYSVLATAEQTRASLDRQTRAGRAASAILAQLRSDLRAATLHRGKESAFIGDLDASIPDAPHRLDLLTLAWPRAMPTVDGEPLRTGPTEVGYQAKSDPAGGPYLRLYRREQMYRDDKPTEGGELEALTGGVFRFKLSFHDGQGWSDQWVDRKTLPRAVRVELGLWAGEGPPPKARDAAAEFVFRQRIDLPGRGLVIDVGKAEGDGSGSGG